MNETTIATFKLVVGTVAIMHVVKLTKPLQFDNDNSLDICYVSIGATYGWVGLGFSTFMFRVLIHMLFSSLISSTVRTYVLLVHTC